VILIPFPTHLQLHLDAFTSNFSTSYFNCWWNTKPSQEAEWEKKEDMETKYIRYLLRENNQNIDNENEDLKQLEQLMTFFGGDMKQVNKAYVLFNQKLFDSFQNYRSFLSKQQRAKPEDFKKDDWKNGKDALQKFKFYDHYTKMTELFDWNHSKFVSSLIIYFILFFIQSK